MTVTNATATKDLASQGLTAQTVDDVLVALEKGIISWQKPWGKGGEKRGKGCAVVPCNSEVGSVVISLAVRPEDEQILDDGLRQRRSAKFRCFYMVECC